jgi:hypothetical protein
MNPYKLKDVFNYLTSNNQLLKRKLKLGTDDIPIPPKRDDVTTIEAINRFNKANPRVDTTNLKPLSVKHSKVKQSNVGEADEGTIQSAFDTATREAQFEGYPAPNYEKFKSRYLKKNMKADGGRIGYKDGPSLLDMIDVQASGTKSGKQQIEGAPEGITSDKETINAILTMDIPLTEKVNLIGNLQYGKFRDRIEYKDNEIFLDDPKSYRDRNIGLDYNRGGEGFSGSATVGDEGPEFNIRYKKSFADGGMLVQPSDDGSRPGYANPKGNPELGTKYTGEQFKGTIKPENQKRLNKVIELITESNGSYKKNLTAKEILQKAGFKDGYQSIGTTQAIRPAIMKEMEKLLTTQQKIDNYVNNVMLSEDALVKDFKNPQQHIAKKFGVSRGTMRNWAKNSEVYKDNKALFNGLSKELSFNKYKFEGDGVPRLMSDYSVITQNKLPSSQMAYGADSPTKFIMDSAFRSYMQNKAAGKTPKIFFVGNPELMSPSEWKFIKGGKLYSTDASITELEFNGKTYKNNYLNRVDAKTLYANDFGNVYKKYDDLNKYMNTFVPDPNNPEKQILLDTLLRRKAFDETGKKNFLERRFVELDHGDLLNDPFGNNNPNNLRLLDRQTNVKAGLFKRLDKYKNNPKLLNKTLTDIGYFNMDKDTDAFIKRMTKKVIPTSSSVNSPLNISLELLKASNPESAKKVNIVLNSGLPVNKIAEELVKIPGVRQFRKAFTALGGPIGAAIEAAFAFGTYNNEISKGTPPATALEIAQRDASFGLAGEVDQARMTDLTNAGSEIGVNTTGFQELKTILDLEKKIEREKALLQSYNQMEENFLPITSQEKEKGFSQDFDFEQQQKKIAELENQYRIQATKLRSSENFDTLFEDYNSAVEYLARKQYNKTLPDRKNRVYPDAGTMGSDFMTTIMNPIQSFLPQNLMETGLSVPTSLIPGINKDVDISSITRPYVRAAQKIPFIGDFFKPTSDAAKLSAMSQEQKDQRALDMNIIKQNYHPVMGTTMRPNQMEEYYENYFSKGGIASLTKTIPPESGPTPHGLPYVYNNVKKI